MGTTGQPKRRLSGILAARTFLVVAALMIAVAASAEPVSAAVRQFTDGRYVKTNGNFCTSYLPGSGRSLRVPLPNVMGFRNGPNRVKITPKVQYSFNLTNPSWNAWFSLPTATFSSDRSYLTDMQMGQWVQPMPDDARPYVVRTVYVFQWAIFDSSGRIAGWTAPYRIAEDYSTYSIFVGTTPTLGEGCVIF